MNQKPALLLAAGITAFVLVVVGGLALRLSTTPASEAPAAIVEPTTDPALQALLAEREAARQQIEQANAQLQEAYQQQQALADQLTPEAQLEAVTPAATPVFAISAEAALAIALQAAPATTALKAPELVSVQGAPAYEVTLDKGLVYVDANTGQVLVNNAIVPAPANVVNASATLLSREQAIQAALAYTGGGTVREVELETEHGVAVYEVKFENGAKVYVHASTGQILRAETERVDDNGGNDDGGHDEDDDHGGDDD